MPCFQTTQFMEEEFAHTTVTGQCSKHIKTLNNSSPARYFPMRVISLLNNSNVYVCTIPLLVGYIRPYCELSSHDLMESSTYLFICSIVPFTDIIL